MPGKERIRESYSTLPTLDYLARRIQEGWKLTAIEWERDAPAPAETAPPKEWVEEIPYGLRVSDDCTQLVESTPEKEIMILALDMIVDDCPLSRIAEELNIRGYQTRDGAAWSPSLLFSLLPRMIQIGPRLFSSEEWTTRRKRLPARL
jgi:hypothetical protein